ncbi:MAG TPA: helix-turn-helix domain-containing protein [Gemmatimonadales bacterium]|nr:helix-turn-helix domain-containing protein [Gemmatimonadales bacterium]
MARAPAVVLDSDASRRDAVVGALKGAGCPVLVAATRIEAAEAVGVAEPGLLVLDLRLPGLDLLGLRQAVHPDLPAAPDSLEAAERRHIARALEYTRGNKREAALLLGIARSTLHAKIRKYRLRPEPTGEWR